MPNRLPHPLPAALSLCMALAAAASGAELKEVTGFGNNPTNLRMHLYVPDKVQARPAILVGLHWCTGTGPAFFTGTQFAAQADRHGFIIIYPSSGNADKCWDVHSQAALTHNGGGDPAGIVSMVRYVARNHNGDSTRVFAAGHSSGGMMTQVMLGSYPDLFKAGAAFAGVPFGCFAGPTRWNADCATGKITRTPEAWGDLVRAAHPGYAGPRPRMQLWHGVKDDVLFFHNFGEAIKQWTQVLGAGQTPVSTEINTPQSGWTRTRYADPTGKVMVEAIRGENQPHNLQILADRAVQFLGLDGTATGIPGVAAGEGEGEGAGAPVLATALAGGRSLRLRIRSAPGRVIVDLLRLDGTRVGTLAEADSPAGKLDFSWNGSLGNGPRRAPGVYLAAAKIDGKPLGAARFAWLAD